MSTPLQPHSAWNRRRSYGINALAVTLGSRNCRNVRAFSDPNPRACAGWRQDQRCLCSAWALRPGSFQPLAWNPWRCPWVGPAPIPGLNRGARWRRLLPHQRTGRTRGCGGTSLRPGKTSSSAGRAHHLKCRDGGTAAAAPGKRSRFTAPRSSWAVTRV
jgi:hypothetical protein